MQSGKCYIGTSGWNYKHWGSGRFYPPKLPQRLWLEYYAQRFGTVEINSSFYRVPTPETIGKWSEMAPEGFRFAVKVWRGITHYRKLKNSRDLLERFFESANLLQARQRGPLLVQLPPNFGIDPGRLDTFLDDLKATTGPSRWKVAVEFRSPDWLLAETYRLLDRHGAAVALVDGRCPASEPNDVSFIYVRRHGANAPEGRYQPAHIRADARRVRQWLQENRTVWVYYNNDWGGHAVDNAAQLLDVVERPAGS